MPAAERYLRDGDIVAITSRDTGGYTSHVGLAYRDPNGVLRFLHASSKQGRVLVDDRLSSYLASKSDDAGIVVARPADVPGRDARGALVIVVALRTTFLRRLRGLFGSGFRR